MNKKRFITIISVVLFLFIALFLTLQKGTFSAEEYKYVFDNKEEVSLYKHELQELIRQTANAFYYNRDYIKYKIGNMPGVEFSYRNFMISPEEINKNNSVYMDDSSFIFSVYINALGIDLSNGILDNFIIENGSGFDINVFKKMIELKDNRLILETDASSYGDQGSFISKYLKSLEVGDIIVYTVDDKYHLALYLGNDGNDKLQCIYFDEESNTSGIYVHDVGDYLFPNNSFLGNNTYYAIIRPINMLSYNAQDKTLIEVPKNSLARDNDVYVRRYTNISTDNVYRGEVINFTIEITNNSNEVKQITKISDIISNYLEFVSVENGYYDSESYEVIWNNIKLNAKETKKFVYSVKVSGSDELGSTVNEDTVYGKEIIAGNAKIYFNEDKVFELNKIRYVIANKYIYDQDNELKKVIEQLENIKMYLNYENDGNNYKNDIFKISNSVSLNEITFNSFIYYNAYGSELEFDGFDSIKDALFLKNENNKYTRNTINNDDNTSVKFNRMVVNNLYGGMSLNDNRKSKIFSSLSNGNFTYNNLLSGDIIISWDNAGNALSYFVFKEINNDKENVLVYSFSKEYGIVVKNLNEILNKIVDNSSLYVVLRPSMVLDIKLKDVFIEPINLRISDEVKIEYTKSPINATISSVSYSESSKFLVDSNKRTIKGISAGTDMLKINFNNSIEKNIKVVISKEIYGFNIVSEYVVDNDNNILFVGNDRNVETILSKINFNADGYDKKIVDSSYSEIIGEISGVAILEVSLKEELIEQYKIVCFMLNDEQIEVVNGEKIIKFINDGTKVNDIFRNLNVNDSSVKIDFYDTDNKKLDSNSVLSTGDFLVFNIDNKLQQQYQLSVLGDISGNGIFNGNDIVLTRRHIVGWKDPQTNEIYEVSGVYEYAMDFTMNGTINGNDVSSMRRKLVG